MKACFQKPDDKTAEHSEVLKRMIFLESYLTAPYGMVREVTSEGKFITAKSRGNQKCFDRKEKINDGVRQYIQDYIELFGFVGPVIAAPIVLSCSRLDLFHLLVKSSLTFFP